MSNSAEDRQKVTLIEDNVSAERALEICEEHNLPIFEIVLPVFEQVGKTLDSLADLTDELIKKRSE